MFFLLLLSFLKTSTNPGNFGKYLSIKRLPQECNCLLIFANLALFVLNKSFYSTLFQNLREYNDRYTKTDKQIEDNILYTIEYHFLLFSPVHHEPLLWLHQLGWCERERRGRWEPPGPSSAPAGHSCLRSQLGGSRTSRSTGGPRRRHIDRGCKPALCNTNPHSRPPGALWQSREPEKAFRRWKIVCCNNWLWTHHKLKVDAILFRDGGHLVCWTWQLGHIISFDAHAGFCRCVIAGVFVFVIKAACLYTLCFMHKMFWDVCHLHWEN